MDNVAEADAARFSLHPSVPFWRTWGTRLDTRSLGNNLNDRCGCVWLCDVAFDSFAFAVAAAGHRYTVGTLLV